ncbi:hypothetical protein BDV95DRAFT_560187 [Massariosphaeria phaeospora]|uniref:Uncharacterized protein n=1 Tax=Massariosphaeria phaeospora TaxID=100035 RepID=A0A7C8MGS2_9PLEO|nr:hypothetical protein BDV95DRAFT_560187 [Massariosphaeria phaeospora]
MMADSSFFSSALWIFIVFRHLQHCRPTFHHSRISRKSLTSSISSLLTKSQQQLPSASAITLPRRVFYAAAWGVLWRMSLSRSRSCMDGWNGQLC